MRCPFSLFKKQTDKGFVWYARFWNYKIKKYTETRSTGIFAEGKKERRKEAEQKARELLPEIRFETEAADRPFLSYLEDFWKPDSPYIKECAILKKDPLSGRYVHNNALFIRVHIKPFSGFNKITLRGLTAGLIKDWTIWAADKNMSGRMINSVLSTMRVAVRYAVEREELDRDPFRSIKKAAHTPKEKGVITFDERAKLTTAPTTDPLSRLAVLFGLFCGMRLGEVRGLMWSDIDNGLIHLIQNFVDIDGLKKPKCGKTRTVPYPAVVEKTLEEVHDITPCPAPETYVFESINYPGKPMGESVFRNALMRELVGIGIPASEQKKRNITFHSLRHSFITLGRVDGFSDLQIQAMAGHSSSRMMEHYSHTEKVIDFKAIQKKMNKAVGM